MQRIGVSIFILFVVVAVSPPSCGGGGSSSGGVPAPPPGARPSAAVTTPVGPQMGNVTVGYSLTDAESDVLTIAVEYSVDGGTTWSPATAGTGGDGTTALGSSPGGVAHTFVWESRTDLVAVNGPVATVQVRITPSDAAAGTPGTSGNFNVNNKVTAFRITTLALRDPHVFADIVICLDATDTAPGGQGINPQTAALITGDTSPADGFYDLSLLLLFRPLDQANGATGRMDLARGQCAVGSTTCDLPFGEIPTVTTYTSASAGTVLTPLPGTTGAYIPAITSPVGPGFSTGTISFVFNLGPILLPLTDVRLGAEYVGAPATSLQDGLIMGFLSEATADTILVPISTGSVALSSLLRGGTGCCSGGSDKDTHNAVVGWWFYFNFTASEVNYVGP
jgi:hypothetical protein